MEPACILLQLAEIGVVLSGCNQSHLCTYQFNSLDILAAQIVEGKQYRTLNSYLSATSMTHLPIDGVVVGKHPFVSRLMKGIFNYV